MPFASPLAAMVATDSREEFQLTEVVRSCVLPSLKVPVAVNGWVVPAAIVGLCGLSCMDTRLGTTFKLVDPACAPKAAEMVELPIATAVACPLPLTVAAAGFEELQVAEVVRS